VLRQGGLKNGDIVHTVNGEKVTNVPQAFAAYMKVRKADTIKVELTRKDGSQRTHIYKLK
jgi:PDZ domain-containing secreted protein